jgi:diketogulonate reductase-like aldo/keto reductase
MCQIALVWIIQKGAMPIVGISSISRLDEACEVKGKSPENEMKWLEELYQPKNIIGK